MGGSLTHSTGWAHALRLLAGTWGHLLRSTVTVLLMLARITRWNVVLTSIGTRITTAGWTITTWTTIRIP